MNQPLSNILEAVNIEKLELQEVQEYRANLQKIVPRFLTPAQKITLLKSKVKLSQRLVELDLARIRLSDKSTAEKLGYNPW